MGYDIHITRRANWSDDDGPIISLEEWKTFVSSDPEIRLAGHADAAMGNGAVLRVVDAGLAVWTAYSGHGVEGNMAWLYPGAGGIIAKNPDNEILRKMFEIAQALDARVVGDDDEEYDANGNVIALEDIDPMDAEPKPIASKRPWWKVFTM